MQNKHPHDSVLLLMYYEMEDIEWYPALFFLNQNLMGPQ